MTSESERSGSVKCRKSLGYMGRGDNLREIRCVLPRDHKGLCSSKPYPSALSQQDSKSATKSWTIDRATKGSGGVSETTTRTKARRGCRGTVLFADEKAVGPGFKGKCWVCEGTLVWNPKAQRVEHELPNPQEDAA